MLLELKNINFGFNRENLLFRNISLSLEEKRVYALMGINGSGKTTLYNLISGFLKPFSGEILFQSKKITNLNPYIVNKRGISRTFQDIRFISKLTVKENVILAMQNNPTDNWIMSLLTKKVYKSALMKIEDQAEEVMSEYYLQEVKNNISGEISYGQQRLLTLACCIANGGNLILLDEPLTGVNEEYQDVLQQKIRKMVLDGRTVVIIDHHTDFICKVADEIFFLNEGAITIFKTMKDFRNNAKVIEAYIS